MRNFLNINTLSEKNVFQLVKRAIALKSGDTPKHLPITAVNLFLKIQHERIVAFKWLRIVLIGKKSLLILRQAQ